MKYNIKIQERETLEAIVLSLLLIVFLTVGVGVCSANAQNRYSDPKYPVQPVKNAGRVIKIAPNANVNAKAVAMRNSINSPYAELKPAFAPSGDRLYFSRVKHPNNTASVNDLEDIWYSLYDSTSSVWSEPIRMPGYLNNSGPNFIENVSKTGDTIILGNQYLKKDKMRDGVSYSVNHNGEWSFPTPIYITNDINLSQHSNRFVSLKLGVIISAVQRTESETYGHRDLYVSFWNGEYATEPVNMGGVINTDMEESSPYLACDNKSLYFASKGHNGYGGYDIFVTTRLDESWTNWSVPQNLGPAVNGNLDEEFFSITHCGRHAIFTKQVSMHNSDLYKVPMEELFKITKPVVPLPVAEIVIKREGMGDATKMDELTQPQESKKRKQTMAAL